MSAGRGPLVAIAVMLLLVAGITVWWIGRDSKEDAEKESPASRWDVPQSKKTLLLERNSVLDGFRDVS